MEPELGTSSEDEGEYEQGRYEAAGHYPDYTYYDYPYRSGTSLAPGAPDFVPQPPHPMYYAQTGFYPPPVPITRSYDPAGYEVEVR